MSRKTDIGRQGEFLAAYLLERNGIECHHVNRQEADLWCKMPNGTLLPVQVKSASKPHKDPRWPTPYRYHFFSRKKDSSIWVACVALDVGIVLMTAPHEPRNWIRKEMFTEYEQAQRMEQFIAASVSPTKDLRHAT